MGLCSAYYLQKAGCDVVLIEKETGPAGASLGNAGMIVPSHFTPLAAPGVVGQALKWLTKPSSPFSVKPRLDWDLISWGLKFLKASRHGLDEKREVLYRLNLDSRKLFEELLNDGDFEVGFKPKGLAMYCATEHALEEEKQLIEISENLGQTTQYLTREEAQGLDPGVEMDIVGAVYYPNDAFLAPHDFIHTLRDLILHRGGSIITNRETEFIAMDGKIDRLVVGGEEVIADEYVLASGIWSADLARAVGLKIPMQAGKGYSFTVDNAQFLPEICSILVEARIAVTPMHHALRFAGTMEIVGMDDRVNQRKLDGITHAIPTYFPQYKGYDFSSHPVWHGFRPCSPDGLPYIGRTAKFSNLTVATGHAMMGLSLGPVTGKMITEEILDDKKGSALVSPDRYA